MLYLSANTNNVIYTSVSVHKTLSKPTYLMTLTHQQTGKRWSFIPQNISSFSGSPYNQRYDLFKFNISATTENLTGGTLAYYHENTPAQVYQDSRYAGTDMWYLIINPIISVVGVHQLRYDFSDKNMEITGATVTLDGVSLPVVAIQKDDSFGQNTWYIQTNVSGGNLTLSGKLEISAETNSGTTMTNSWYVSSMSNVYNVEPWTLYGYTKEDIVNLTLPTTYIDTPSVNIDEIGEFRYSIREQVNPININPAYTTESLENGLAYVYQGFDDIYYDRGGDDIVYDPNN